MKRIACLALLLCLLLTSCAPAPPAVGDRDTTPAEESYMAQMFGNMYRVDDDLYFLGSTLSGSFDVNKAEKGNVLATEYGAETLDFYVPCFDSLCTHYDRSRCCLCTCDYATGLYAYYDGEPVVIVYSDLDTILARPYSNIKSDFLCEDYVYSSMSKLKYLKSLTNLPTKYNMMVLRAMSIILC